MNAVTRPKILNSGQQTAADGFFDFLFSADTQMILSGGGGVGKTFLMGHLIDHVMPEYFKMCQLMGINSEYDSVIMTATTNKAAQVLGIATGRPSQTIHSFLGLKVHDDYSTGQTRLAKTKSWKVHERMIIFIDECSMIDTPLYQTIQEGTHKCKIVYVGDHCQLAPVMESISPIYTQGLPFYNLTEPMRNANQPALMALCQQLRETVETGQFKPIQVVPGVIDWVDDPTMEGLVQQTFATQTRDARILSYTNRRVIQYNEHIRDLRGLPAEYGVGELLVNNQAISFGSSNTRKMVSVEDDIEILSQDSHTTRIGIDDKEPVKLEVRWSRIRTGLGNIFTQVPIPTDRGHFMDLLKYYQQQKNWTRKGALKDTFPDLRPRDAATVHKAQGSTYDTTFIDVGDLSSCRQPDAAARLLYVGCSRAQSRVILYGELADKYGGIIN